MITVLVYKDEHTPEFRISAYGHANAGKKGEDVVCAAVSTIMQVAELGLRKSAEDYPEHVEVIVHGSDNGRNTSQSDAEKIPE